MSKARSTRWGALAAVSVALAALGLAACEQGPTRQGWSWADRDAWYNAGQGSRLAPLAWVTALEQPSGATPAATPPAMFMDSGYLEQFRILPPEPGAQNSLPVGFAIDASSDTSYEKTKLRWFDGQQDQEQWVGLNCAACHTGQMTYRGQTVRVDGAPSLFDFQSFLEAFDLALTQTRDAAAPGADASRWDRFATRVLGASDNPANRAKLLAALNQLIAWEADTAAINKTDSRYCFGRVDAVGHIFNRILLFGGATQPTPNAANAPVDYPHLWNITKQTHLQWDGIATTNKISLPVPTWLQWLPFLHATPFDYGALGRNAGEVLGVFGEVVFKPPPPSNPIAGFTTSADVTNLNRMELELTRLQSPAWPTSLFGEAGATPTPILGPTGQPLTPAQVVQAGSAVFVSEHCNACHTPNATSYETMVTFQQLLPPSKPSLPSNLTDEWMACNTWANRGLSGRLAGIKADYVSGDPTPASSPVRSLLATAVKGALIGQKVALVGAGAQTIFSVTPLPTVIKPHVLLALPPQQTKLDFCMQNAANPLMAYKARPLEGIWATAPYLHNGSVPTLYDLLRLPADRPATFKVGTRVYDPVRGGYSTDPAAPGNSFTFDTTQQGNSNKGHAYGADMSETDRLELVAYLKSL
jgi:hypothetical protein